MAIASIKQNFQDWITQQWVILFGNKIDLKEQKWLLGPFGRTNGIGLKFIDQLAKQEHLKIDTQNRNKGLIQSISELNLDKDEILKLSKHVINFYENTANYDLELKVKWNPFFKIFGILLRIIFSKRIQQLNVPIQSIKDSKELTNKIIHLIDPTTNEVKRKMGNKSALHDLWIYTITSVRSNAIN